MNQLIEDIKTKLNIKGGVFIDMEIEDYIKHIDPSQYLEFFKDLSGDGFGYKNPMDRIAMTAKKFKQARTDNLLSGTREQAKAMYDKFYRESAAMLDFTCKNRNKYPSDREFFRSVDYSSLRRKDGGDAYTRQEIYVLNELGAGDFLLGIRLALSSKEVIDKIESVIKKAVMTKYDQQTISNNVTKMLKR